MINKKIVERLPLNINSPFMRGYDPDIHHLYVMIKPFQSIFIEKWNPRFKDFPILYEMKVGDCIWTSNNYGNFILFCNNRYRIDFLKYNFQRIR